MTFFDEMSQYAPDNQLKISCAKVRCMVDKGIFETGEHNKCSLKQATKAYAEYQKTVDDSRRTKSRKRAVKLV